MGVVKSRTINVIPMSSLSLLAQVHSGNWLYLDLIYIKGDAENPIHNTLSKLLQPISQLTRKQQGYAYNHSFITFIQIYGCKETPVGLLYAEKMAVIFSLNRP